MGPFVDQGSKKGLQELHPFQSQLTQSMHAIQFKAFNSKHAKVSTKWYMFLHISPSYLLIQQLPLQSLQSLPLPQPIFSSLYHFFTCYFTSLYPQYPSTFPSYTIKPFFATLLQSSLKSHQKILSPNTFSYSIQLI